MKFSNFIISKAIMLLFWIGPVKWMWKLSVETFKRSIKFQLSSGFYVFTNVAKHLALFTAVKDLPWQIRRWFEISKLLKAFYWAFKVDNKKEH